MLRRFQSFKFCTFKALPSTIPLSPLFRFQTQKHTLASLPRGPSMSAPQEGAAVGPSPAAPAAPRATDQSSSKQVLAQSTNPDGTPMSKNALKRLRKAQAWEEGKADRKAKKKEKRVARVARKRDEREALLASGVDRSVVYPQKPPSTLVPVSLVLDCDFEKYMTDKERISLASQVTRSYSENRSARWRAHLWVAGWGGRLLERFEGPLDRQHEHWKNVGFCEGDFAKAALQAEEGMKKEGGKMIDPLQRSTEQEVQWQRDMKDPFPLPDPEPEPTEAYKDIVYLTSDSPYTISRLEPNKSYIIGGLVDKNREKGLCYRRARERGVRTAKLPIGEYMSMSTRQVLATNHVVEIMLKWLEYEDWGKAFEAVIPKRKGGVLKPQGAAEGAEEDEDEPVTGESADKAQEESAETSHAEPSQTVAESKAEGS